MSLTSIVLVDKGKVITGMTGMYRHEGRIIAFKTFVTGILTN